MANKKSARASLSFETPPPAKSRKLQSPFSPKRSAANIISATKADADFERDSLTLQPSRTTARIRLQEKFVKVATIQKDECSPEEIKECTRDIAFNAMAKSVKYEDINPADRANGGFKKKNVRAANIFFPLTNGLCMNFSFCSNIDPCPTGTRLCDMCLPVLIVVAAITRFGSRCTWTRL